MNMRSRTAEVAPIVVSKGEKGSCSILEHMGCGPCYQFAAVADSLLCGLVGKIVAQMENNCKRLLDDEFNRAGVGCGLV
jgi:hypothetical protein